MGKLFLVTSVIATVAAFCAINQIFALPDGHSLVREPPIWSLGTPSVAPPSRPRQHEDSDGKLPTIFQVTVC